MLGWVEAVLGEVEGQISQIYDALSMKLCFVIYNIAGPLGWLAEPGGPPGVWTL